MANQRSGADEIRAGYAELIRTDFDFRRVSGLTENPAVTQNPTRFTPEPYVYIYSDSQLERDVTLDDTPYDYKLMIEVCVRYNSYRGGQRQADEILDQVIDLVRGKRLADYPDLSQYGYRIYRANTGEINNLTNRDRGANYYKLLCELFVTAKFIGVTGSTDPVQAASYSYSGFEFSPTGRGIEMWDAGDIIGASTYSNNNNGYDFVSVDYAKTASGQGTLSGSTLTLDSDDAPIGLLATLNYELGTDTTQTRTITDSDNWARLRSVRYGAVTPAVERVRPSFTDTATGEFGLRNLSAWNTATRMVDFGDTQPHGNVVNISLTRGQYSYIVVDQAHTLIGITDNVFGTNVLSQFIRTEVGGYATYVSSRPAIGNESYTYNLTTS